MGWVTDDLTETGIAGTTVADTNVISKVFRVEDPRFLVVEVVGGLTAFKIQTKCGNGTWKDVETSATAKYDFVTNPADTTPLLLAGQTRIVATGAGDVDNVFIVRKM